MTVNTTVLIISYFLPGNILTFLAPRVASPRASSHVFHSTDTKGNGGFSLDSEMLLVFYDKEQYRAILCDITQQQGLPIDVRNPPFRMLCIFSSI